MVRCVITLLTPRVKCQSRRGSQQQPPRQMESVVITWLLRENEARLLKVKTRCLIVLDFRRARFPYGQHLERRDPRRPRASTIGTGYLKVRSLQTKFTTVTGNLRASSRSISDWPESISGENLKRVWNLVW